MAEQNVKPLRLAVLISGRGSNLQALIDACARDDFPASIEIVVSNKAGAYGLQRAEAAGIETAVVPHQDFESKQGFEAEIINIIEPYHIDLICLAGFMRIVSPLLINYFGAHSMINIHPSLLPDYKGLNTHQRALDDGRDEAGCSVHYVVAEVDAGEIIVQKRVPILDGDDADRLAARVLEQEHIAYPEAVRLIADHNT